MSAMQRERPIANGSFLVAQSPSGQQSFVAARIVLFPVVRGFEKQTFSSRSMSCCTVYRLVQSGLMGLADSLLFS